MSSLQQKYFLKSISNSHITLSFLFIWKCLTTNTLIHNRSSLVHHTQFQTKMGKIYTRFQTKATQNPTFWGSTYSPPPQKKPFFVFLAFPLNNITYQYFTNKVVTKLRKLKDKGCTLYDVYMLLFCLKGTRLL